MFSILHISDLHRTPNAKISNEELLSALIRDRDSYTRGDNPIRSPDAIVVSGDIVQGVPLKAPNGQATLQAQYDEAEDFLRKLAAELVEGDHSRVIIVPGNHDIDWQLAKQAMQLVEVGDLPANVLGALQEPSSLYRFSWATREVFQIFDTELYGKRLDAFWKFFESFYFEVAGLLRVKTGSDANLYSLHGGRIGVAAFNSCHGNDCFTFHGSIPAKVISQTHLDMRSLGPFELSIAVWHHNLEGPPYRTDYMDIEIVRAMIARGFRVGMYGHQHRAQVSAQSLRLAASETMAILGTGALCAGGADLPSGSNRQYSIIEINDDLCSALVHVREVMASDMFGPASLPSFGRRSSMEVTWDRPTNSLGAPIDTEQRALTTAVEVAERLVKASCHADAVTKLWPLRNQLSGYGRKLLLSAAEAARDWPPLVELTLEPGSIEELVLGVEARIRMGDCAAAKAHVAQYTPRLQLPAHQASELLARIAAEEGLRKK
ncbi:metallophosphoesterase family protein [Aromatoleum petrolei]|uniref:Calcineurin-like phosphoesterase domain-containing protein n=1 Tax=Aromatoleum petrolei TaxID=76116 RepID=A0ABX1MNB4_9RHOO|nr:metallophosphoesterase [Aromatoleum petrolei]NMF88171.1 hypothetical protein [Aromatoleum petrolei]QTQ38969.1 Calcineurin-like phosphoesterase domain-containing protein [Aromatoleum petrolei]